MKTDRFLKMIVRSFVVNPKHLFYVLRQLEEDKDDPETRALFKRLSTLRHLSLTQRFIESLTVKIPFSHFAQLSYLELRKVKISNLSLSDVKTKLLGLYCDSCDCEEALEAPWKLEFLTFNNRSWKPLKLDFLKSMPWLVELNLSHNNLKSCNLEHCKSLIHVNLRYNHLTTIPKLNKNNNLRTLLLSNNFITDLTGLENLGLAILDLSFNIITILQIDLISTLKELKHIEMKNNLFAAQLDKKYRIFMASKIRSKHSVELDSEKITDAEKDRSRQREERRFFKRLIEKAGRS